MHVVVFVLGLVATGLFASIFSARAIQDADVTFACLALLFWIGAFALVWMRWVRKPAKWLARVAAIVGVVLLASIVYRWLPQTDVFVEHRRHGTRAGSFWKLIATWAAGAIGIRYALLGKLLGAASSVLRWPLRATLTVWSVACLYVFVRNVSVDVALQSLKAASGLLIFGGIIALIALVFWIRAIPQRKREKLAATDFTKIAPARRRELVAMAEQYARGVEHCLSYRADGMADWDVRKAHVGGSALLSAHDAWPVDEDGHPGRFLVQLPIAEALPAPWTGRSLALWITNGYEVLVRSVASGAAMIEVPQPPLPLTHGYEPVSKLHLSPLILPVPREEDDEARGDAFCATLLRECVELRDALDAITDQPEALLPMLLQDDARARELDPVTAVWVGGKPQLIQGEHDAACEICKRPMRFLFSAGDFTEDMAFGDAGVAYVYGCDDHPEHCQAFVDCH